MTELEEYREKLLIRLSAAAGDFRQACLAVGNPHAALEGNGWTVHQLAVHTRDVSSLVYGRRVRRTLTEEDPEFSEFDGEAYLAAHYDSEEPLPGLLDGLVADVDELIALLRKMPLDGWSRTSRHETQGDGLTLQLWVERNYGHIQEHLETVKKAG